RPIVITIVKEKTSWINIPVCLQSETPNALGVFMMVYFNLIYKVLKIFFKHDVEMHYYIV
uniref:hypothetical protein n=1 Tax=Streptococcus agalactiae TaxID=1311 RepID=UPI00114D01AC